MMQFFEWNIENDGGHWERLKNEAHALKQMGVSAVLIPPCTKAAGQYSVGYNAYDLYDLGEFDQKGTVRTKYGTKQQLLAAIEEAHRQGVKVYADVVLNHKAGADETEAFLAVEVDPNDRKRELSGPQEIEGWTKFTFPGRGEKYSAFKWDHAHFIATDWDERSSRNAIFKIYGFGKDWSSHVDDEKSNFDFLMCADIDYHNEYVVEEIKRWAIWFIDELHVDGFRLDALKHIDQTFVKQLISHVQAHAGTDFFVMGEYWDPDQGKFVHLTDAFDQTLHLVDVPLHLHFHEASQRGRDFDLTRLFDGTLVSANPLRAVTFVDNHDSQPGQTIGSWVEDWFKPIAYALILLRMDGLPCVFYGDYYGIVGQVPPKRDTLEPLLYARKHLAYGEQVDHFDHSNVIGFVRKGDAEHADSGVAVVISNGEDGTKRMAFGPEHAGREFFDLTGNRGERITLDKDGAGTFTVNGGSVSVWASVAHLRP